MLLPYNGKTPKIGARCFIAPNAVIVGDVTLGDDCSVWFGAVIRGDGKSITIGDRTNVQDNVTIHCDAGPPVVIGSDVSIGHNAVVHGAALGDRVLVGMGAVVMDGAVIGGGSTVGAGALVTKCTAVPPMSQVMGLPAKVVKTGLESLGEQNLHNARKYVERKDLYLRLSKKPL